MGVRGEKVTFRSASQVPVLRFFDGLPQHAYHEINLLLRDDKGWCEHDLVAPVLLVLVVAWMEEHALHHALHDDIHFDILLGWKRLLGFFVLNEFYAPEHTLAADVAYHRQRHELQQALMKVISHLLGALDQALIFYDSLDLIADGARERVSRECVQVLKFGFLLFEQRHDLVLDSHAGKRRIAAADPLREYGYVGYRVEMVHAHLFTGSPKAGYHLIGDKDDVVLIADLATLCRGRARRASMLE